MGALLLLLASFLLPFGRNAWLVSRLDGALQAVPGELRGDWSWPRLDLLEGRHMLWTAPATTGADVDTLAVVERVSIRFNLWALRGRRLEIHELDLEASRLDVPRILVHFPKTGADDDSLRTARKIPYLLEGSVPSYPSAEIKDLRVAVGSLVLPGGIAASNLKASASATVRDHATPQLVVNSGSAFVTSRAATSWQLELASLQAGATYDPGARAVTLDSLVAAVPSLALAADTLRIHAGPADVRASGTWADGKGDLAADVRFQAEIPVALQDRIAAIEVREVAGRLALQAHATTTTLQLDTTLDLDPSPDVRRGHGRGSLLADLQPRPRLREVRLDSLNVQWRRATIEAAGAWDVDTVDGRFVIDLGDLELAAVLAPALMDGVTGRARLDGMVAGAPNDPRITGRVVASGDIASIWKLPGVAEAAKRLPPGFPRDEFQRLAPDVHADLDGTLSALRIDLRPGPGPYALAGPWRGRGERRGRARFARNGPGSSRHVGIGAARRRDHGLRRPRYVARRPRRCDVHERNRARRAARSAGPAGGRPGRAGRGPRGRTMARPGRQRAADRSCRLGGVRCTGIGGDARRLAQRDARHGAGDRRRADGYGRGRFGGGCLGRPDAGRQRHPGRHLLPVTLGP
ncbi:MAG: hypothetical protein IPP62_10250 [bacterium]|nr:hypothetical protein [bacterium]